MFSNFLVVYHFWLSVLSLWIVYYFHHHELWLLPWWILLTYCNENGDVTVVLFFLLLWRVPISFMFIAIIMRSAILNVNYHDNAVVIDCGYHYESWEIYCEEKHSQVRDWPKVRSVYREKPSFTKGVSLNPFDDSWDLIGDHCGEQSIAMNEGS